MVPEKFVGKTIGQVGFNKNYNVIVLTTMRLVKEKNMIGIPKIVKKRSGTATASNVLNEGDVMVLNGHNKNLQNIMED